MATLLTTTELTAKFKPGSSALGHHWELFDADEQELGRTKREYGGSALKRGLWRAVTATGMDSDNDIRAGVLDADGQAVAHLFSRNEKGARRVEVDGAGVVHHDDDGFRYEDTGGTLLARLAIDDAKTETPAWQLSDAAGSPLGVVSQVPAKRVRGAGITDYLVGMDFAMAADRGRDFQNTMHLGFNFSHVYSVSLPELPPAGPLRTLAVLTPVILGYAY